jgi:hypothetical protein
MPMKVSQMVAEIVRGANKLSVKYELLKQENDALRETLRRERLKNAGIEHELIKSAKG